MAKLLAMSSPSALKSSSSSVAAHIIYIYFQILIICGNVSWCNITRKKPNEAIRMHGALPSCLHVEAWCGVNTECQRTEMSHGIPRESKQMQTPRGQARCKPANNTISGKGENVSQVQTTNKFSVRVSLCVCPYQHRLLNITTVLG